MKAVNGLALVGYAAIGGALGLVQGIGPGNHSYRLETMMAASILVNSIVRGRGTQRDKKILLSEIPFSRRKDTAIPDEPHANERISRLDLNLPDYHVSDNNTLEQKVQRLRSDIEGVKPIRREVEAGGAYLLAAGASYALAYGITKFFSGSG